MTKRRAPSEPIEFEDEFHKHLGRLVHETARFDFFLGLQLMWLGARCGVDVSEFLDPVKVTLSVRLRSLRRLVKQAFSSGGTGVLNEFEAWFARADAARALRNGYAHGRWGTPGRLAENPLGPEHPRVPMLAFVALDWDMSPDQRDRSVYMTMDEFREQVADVVAVFYQFFQLSERHMKHVR